MSDQSPSETRQQFEAVLDDLRAMDSEEFRTDFQALVERLEVFDEETDSLLLKFSLDDDGIDTWRLKHLDHSRSGSVSDKVEYVEYVGEASNSNRLGENTFSISFSNDGAPAPEHARKALYAAFREVSKLDNPNDVICTPDLIMDVHATDVRFSISYT